MKGERIRLNSKTINRAGGRNGSGERLFIPTVYVRYCAMSNLDLNLKLLYVKRIKN